MKRTDIIFKDKCIVLGIFGTDTFRYFEYMEGVEEFTSFSMRYNGNVMDIVRQACGWAHQIIFVLDGVSFPINTERSVTCKELALICNSGRFLKKTIFVKGEDVINFDKNLVNP